MSSSSTDLRLRSRFSCRTRPLVRSWPVGHWQRRTKQEPRGGSDGSLVVLVSASHHVEQPDRDWANFGPNTEEQEDDLDRPGRARCTSSDGEVDAHRRGRHIGLREASSASDSLLSVLCCFVFEQARYRKLSQGKFFVSFELHFPFPISIYCYWHWSILFWLLSRFPELSRATPLE